MPESMNREKTQEALLVITTGFIVLFYFYHNEWMITVALLAGLTGVFVKPLATLVAKGWFKLGELLGFVVSKVILALLFYILIVPISFLHNLFNKDTLALKRQHKSLWSNRDHEYNPSDLLNTW
jgi:hypothetical protein